EVGGIAGDQTPPRIRRPPLRGEVGPDDGRARLRVDGGDGIVGQAAGGDRDGRQIGDLDRARAVRVEAQAIPGQLEVGVERGELADLAQIGGEREPDVEALVVRVRV